MIAGAAAAADDATAAAAAAATRRPQRKCWSTNLVSSVVHHGFAYKTNAKSIRI